MTRPKVFPSIAALGVDELDQVVGRRAVEEAVADALVIDVGHVGGTWDTILAEERQTGIRNIVS